MSAPKSPKKKPKKPAQRGGKPNDKTGATTYDLDSLAKLTGPADPDLDAATFQTVREDALAAEGARVDSQNILDDLPRFVGSGLEIRAALSADQAKKLRLPHGYFALVVAHGIKLRALKAKHETNTAGAAAGKADREAAARRETRDAIAERDSIYDALRNALGDDVIPKISAIVGTAETPDKLAAGLEGLAAFIEDVLKNGDKTEKL